MKTLFSISFMVLLNIPLKCNAESSMPFDIISKHIYDVGEYSVEFEKIISLLISGNYNQLLKLIYQKIISNINGNINYNKIMLTIIIICLFSVISNFVLKGDDTEYTDKITLCTVGFVVFELYSNLYNIAQRTLESITGFMQMSMPVYFSISSVFYNKLPYGVYSFLLFFVDIFQYASINFIFPSISLLLILTTVTALCPDFDTSSIKKIVNSLIMWLLGLYTTIFVIGIKITQTLVYGSGKIFLSGIKYVVSHGVPVVGNFLSDTAETLINSVILLHNSFGIAGIIVIIFIVFSPAILIFLHALIFSLVGSVFTTLSKSQVCNYILSVSSHFYLLLAVLLCASVTFIIVISTEISAFG